MNLLPWRCGHLTIGQIRIWPSWQKWLWKEHELQGQLFLRPKLISLYPTCGVASGKLISLTLCFIGIIVAFPGVDGEIKGGDVWKVLRTVSRMLQKPNKPLILRKYSQTG